MQHDRLSLQVETGRATAKLIATLLGGVFVLSSFAIPFLFAGSFSDTAYQETKVYRDVLAAIGALLLAIPLWWHAAHCLFSGHMHMDELVALAILAAFAVYDYQTAGVVAFSCSSAI